MINESWGWIVGISLLLAIWFIFFRNRDVRDSESKGKEKDTHDTHPKAAKGGDETRPAAATSSSGPAGGAVALSAAERVIALNWVRIFFIAAVGIPIAIGACLFILGSFVWPAADGVIHHDNPNLLPRIGYALVSQPPHVPSRDAAAGSTPASYVAPIAPVQSETDCLDLLRGEKQGCDVGTDNTRQFLVSSETPFPVCWDGDWRNPNLVRTYWVKDDPTPYTYTFSDEDRARAKVAWQLHMTKGKAHVTYYAC